MGIDSDTLYGTLNLLVLRALRDEPLHGVGVMRRIEAATDGRLRIEEGALYPALHRLERDGLIEGAWGRTPENRRAKYYGITEAGGARLEAEARRWQRHARAVADVLTLDDALG